MKFEKYHGLGNDYYIYDCQKYDYLLSKQQIKLLCDRHYGMGSDGILIGPVFKDGMIGLRIMNPDGSEAEKSGNGVRIFAKYLKDSGYVTDDFCTLDTIGGPVAIKYLNEEGTMIEASMGHLSFSSVDIGMPGPATEVINQTFVFGDRDYRCTCVSVGNPHCIIPVEKVSKELVTTIGKHAETASYWPNRINTQIMEVIDRCNIRIEIFERGAGYTLASGSSACAAAAAAYKLGLTEPSLNVHMPGGVLEIHINKDWNVTMTGKVLRIGSFTLSEEFMRDYKLDLTW
ncbi:MAG: diaminopimelate epimerase [Lachnospiraceae bacterium]|nr:diaminopimelate epimerase [Lachnospiraceae bacterium]